MMPRILVVEDEAPLTLLLRYNLEAAGYIVDVAERGDEAETKLQESLPDLLILDWMLPGVSGIEICRHLRARPQTRQLPIIILTARGEESERLRGLATGADDYIVKPFSVPELVARVQALLRRAAPEKVADILSFGDLAMDRSTRRVSRAGRAVELGPTEYRLLEHLVERPGRVLSREQLLDGVWGHDVYIDERTVDVHIGRLRRALKQDGKIDPIRTVRGAGYALNDRFARSAAYELFEQAMRTRKQICCMYDGYPRELCPVILGHSQGQEKALTYQFGGKSNSGLGPEGDWRCLWLSKVSDVQLRDGPWRVGTRHTQPHRCVDDVDLDVNPASPYHPRRLVDEV